MPRAIATTQGLLSEWPDEEALRLLILDLIYPFVLLDEVATLTETEALIPVAHSTQSSVLTDHERQL